MAALWSGLSGGPIRFDDARPIEDLDPVRRFLPQIMPSRVGATLLFEVRLDIAPVLAWLAAQTTEGPEIRLFHVVLAATLRTLVERPQLNRFVLGGRLMQRESLSLSFSVKRGKRDESTIVATKVSFHANDTLIDVRRKVDAAIAASREQSLEELRAGLRRANALPRPLVRAAVRGAARAERLGLLPPSVAQDDPMHTSAFVGNLGSLGLDASYHHLDEVGTASLHAMVGRVKPDIVVGEDREPRVTDVLTLKIAIDDRIADGAYCARALQRLEHWLTHPAALCVPVPHREDMVCGRLWIRARTEPERPAYYLRSTTENGWFASYWGRYLEEVRDIGHALIGLGVQPGDRVAILGSNRPEWVLTHVAAMAIGAVPCGLHEDLSARALREHIALAEPAVVLLETAGPLVSVRRAAPDATFLLMTRRRSGEGEPPARDDRDGIHWDDLLADGAAADDGSVERRMAAVASSDPATMVFTSGTTGTPRAVVLTHANVAWTAAAAADALGVTSDDRSISYLPLSHIAEQMFSIYAAISSGGSVAFAPSRSEIAETIREVRPTVFFGVPQIWRRLRRDAEGVVVGARRRDRLARRLSGGPDPRLVALGLDRCRLALSGAAAQEPGDAAYFAGLGLPLLETYGQSEGSGPTTLELPDARRVGTVGAPLLGTRVRIAADGEILVRGPHVFSGYFRDPEATASALEEGWLRSGDLGQLEGGHLRVVGRKKALIVLTTGKKVSPGPIETALLATELVFQAVVVGTDRPYLTALIAVDTVRAVRMLAEEGHAPTGALIAHPRVVRAIEAAIAGWNRTAGSTEQIGGYRLLARPLTPEDGELTPTLKPRRAVIAHRYAPLIDALYERRDTQPTPEALDPVVSLGGFTARPAEAHVLDDLFALRYEAFHDRGYLEPGAWPDGRMEDAFDADALHLELRDPEGALAGTARIVTHGPRGLPVQTLFDFDPVRPGAGLGEIGRLAIHRRWRGRRAPLVTLVRAAVQNARLAGYEEIYAFIPHRSIRAYGHLGIPVWELPVRAPSPENVAARRAMAGYFASEDPRVVLFTRPTG